MIPVQEQPEPPDFNEKVRLPGQKFLGKTPNPTVRQLNRRNYWTRILSDLHAAYNGICAYSAHWISGHVAFDTADHFVPKSVAPELTYEWSNLRLCSPKMNLYKGDYLDVVDPFKIEAEWFVMDFSTYLIEANPGLSPEIVASVNQTINRLRLNDDDRCVQDRYIWLREYCESECTLEHLERKYPFMANELRRQGMVEEIKSRMAKTR
jgi:hypothetical protein